MSEQPDEAIKPPKPDWTHTHDWGKATRRAGDPPVLVRRVCRYSREVNRTPFPLLLHPVVTDSPSPEDGDRRHPIIAIRGRVPRRLNLVYLA